MYSRALHNFLYLRCIKTLDNRSSDTGKDTLQQYHMTYNNHHKPMFSDINISILWNHCVLFTPCTGQLLVQIQILLKVCLATAHVTLQYMYRLGTSGQRHIFSR